MNTESNWQNFEIGTEVDWKGFKEKYVIGDKVEGTIIHKMPFGVFIDIGEKFLVLLEIIVMEGLYYDLYRAEKQFNVGESVQGSVAGFTEGNRQMRIIQER